MVEMVEMEMEMEAEVEVVTMNDEGKMKEGPR